MYRAVPIKEGVYWVGAIDWDIRYFHGPAYSTHRGTTYNAYLVMDEKVALVDTVYRPFTQEMLERISSVIDPKSIDLLVVNHIEPDHSGAIPAIMELNPQIPIYCSGKAKEGLIKHYQGDWDYRVVKTGDSISLGKQSLTFVEAPMLHWPDSMFTYLPEQALLMPNDAFGMHLATSERFDDQVEMEVVMAEASKYYANILLPFSKLVLKKLEEVGKMGIPIEMIAPSHGIIWRSHPEKIIGAYQNWASGATRQKVVIAYETMWESTQAMARALSEGVASQGVEAHVFHISRSDRNDMVEEMMDAGAIAIGSSTINNDLLPEVSPLLDDLINLKFGGRLGLAFGSYGWRGGAAQTISQKLTAAGMDLLGEPLTVQWVPTSEELQHCYAQGQALAQALKERG